MLGTGQSALSLPQNELFKFQLYLSAIEGTEIPPPPEGYKGDDGAAPYEYDAQSVASSVSDTQMAHSRFPPSFCI